MREGKPVPVTVFAGGLRIPTRMQFFDVTTPSPALGSKSYVRVPFHGGKQ